MHHGIKIEDEMNDLYYSDIDQCRVKPKCQVSVSHLGRHLLQGAQGYAKENKQWHVLGKGCPLCIEDCMPTISCRPLAHCESPTEDQGKRAGPANKAIIPGSCG